MAATHHLFNYAPTTASATIPTSASDHLNMLGLRDVVFISPQQQHHHHQPIIPSSAAAALGVGVSIFPLLAATPCVDIASTDPQAASSSLAAAKKDNIPMGIEIERLDDGGSGNGNVNSGGSNMRACRDCGNRAKKECSYRRCRTCCKSRGYDCATHVKSTWVPASRRRERQVAMVGISFAGGGSSGSSSGAAAKKQRVENASSASNSATPRSFESSPFRQDASFKQSLPSQVRAPAVFRCIRVTAISDNAAELAYQATVSISGHVFKGYLYDHGTGAKNSSGSIASISKLRLEEGTTSMRDRDSSPPPPIVNPSNAFAAASGSQRLLGVHRSKWSQDVSFTDQIGCLKMQT
ncbi:protein LATERAL ROOT PRIMORDIUM 1 isoform X2 [Punica granatum]|uniref:Protein LATERAL ROOT PRIMORDIUM 1 isoform X2 n=1 Tax=Punica granatum TaxID=22663 RepID=A0A6P8E3G2_PUNGR|nr:protein LATERAL ROOT PRIMORDIUM 1 isoform X2 [Punica granatum]XP_031399981.1 protein LATERAL ROOT PRIMORDIUM 1 isoform X2 [Punica granatum]